MDGNRPLEVRSAAWKRVLVLAVVVPFVAGVLVKLRVCIKCLRAIGSAKRTLPQFSERNGSMRHQSNVLASAVLLLCLIGSAGHGDEQLKSTLREIQPPGGAPLVLWIGPGGTKLNAEALSKTSKRLEAAPKEDLTKWAFELHRITNEKLESAAENAELFMWFVNHVSVAFEGEKWNAKAANNLFKRAQTLSSAESKTWKEAFEALLKNKIEKGYSVPLVLVPVEALHEGEKYSPERGKKYLARLKQLTAEDVSFWKNRVDEFGGTELDAAVNVILQDGWFEKEVFQREKFNAAIEAKTP